MNTQEKFEFVFNLYVKGGATLQDAYKLATELVLEIY